MPEVCARSVVTWRRLSLAVATSAALVAAASPATAAQATVEAAKLSVSVNGNPATAAVGANVTYTIKVTNSGPNASGDVHVKDNFPNADFVSTTGASCTPTPVPPGTEDIDCSLGNLNNNETIIVKVVAAPTANAAGDTITNTATVEEGGAVKATDSDDTAVTAAAADLAVTAITVGDQRAGQPNDPFDVVVKNLGPNDAQNVNLQLTVPDKVKVAGFPQPPPPPPGCKKLAVGATCKLPANGGNLPADPNKKVKTTFTVIVDKTATVGDAKYTASVTSPTPDPDNTNNQLSETIKIT